MGIKIPNTLEPASSDFPVVETNHIKVSNDDSDNLTNYLANSYNNLSDKLDTQREDLLTEISSHNSTIGTLLTTLSSDIQVKFTEAVQGTSDALTTVENAFTANALDISNKHQDLVNIINSLKDTLGLHNSTIGALLAAVSSDIGTVKQMITNNAGLMENLGGQISGLDNELTGDNPTSNKDYLKELTDSISTQLNNTLNSINYNIKNTTDRVKIEVFNISADTANVKLVFNIDADESITTDPVIINEGATLSSNTTYPISSLNKQAATPFKVTIQKDNITVYSKSINIMRKAPIYVGHSINDITSITSLDSGIFTSIFTKSYLTDSLYGECEIPANSWSDGDSYLYIAIPKTYFTQKSVETGNNNSSEDVDLQLLQNGFPVGSRSDNGGDYFIYRSSQMISEHSTLELK